MFAVKCKSVVNGLTHDYTALQGIVNAANEEGNVQQAACPLPGCRLPITPAPVATLMDPQAAARFQTLLAQHHVNTNPLIRWYSLVLALRLNPLDQMVQRYSCSAPHCRSIHFSREV